MLQTTYECVYVNTTCNGDGDYISQMFHHETVYFKSCSVFEMKSLPLSGNLINNKNGREGRLSHRTKGEKIERNKINCTELILRLRRENSCSLYGQTIMLGHLIDIRFRTV